jgi:hypothetical protein
VVVDVPLELEEGDGSLFLQELKISPAAISMEEILNMEFFIFTLVELNKIDCEIVRSKSDGVYLNCCYTII